MTEASHSQAIREVMNRLEARSREPELTNVTTPLLLELLSGRDHPLDMYLCKTHNGQRLAIFPPTDYTLMRSKLSGEEVWEGNTLLPSSEYYPIADSSLAGIFDSVRFAQATPKLYEQVGHDFGKDPRARELSNRDGRQIARIIPADPGVVWQRDPVLETQLNQVDLKEKGLKGHFVVLSPDFAPQDMPRLIEELTNLHAGESAPFVANLLAKFAAAKELVGYYNTVLQDIGAEHFEEGYFPGDDKLSRVREITERLSNELNDLVSAIENLLPEGQKDSLRIDLHTNFEETGKTFTKFTLNDLVHRLHLFGVSDEGMRQLLRKPGQSAIAELVDEAIVAEKPYSRLPQEKAHKALGLYAAILPKSIWNPKGDYLRHINSLERHIETKINPQWGMVEVLAARAQDILVNQLNIPSPLKETYGTPPSARTLVDVPIVVSDWLKREGFAEKVNTCRKEVNKAYAEVEKLSPEEKVLYEELKQEFSEYIKEALRKKRELELKSGQRDEHYPLEAFFTSSVVGDFFLFSNRHNPNRNPKVLEVFKNEQIALFDMAREENSIIDDFLRFQNKSELGYEGWRNDGKKRGPHDKTAFLESRPSRIIVEEWLNCVGRTGLMYSMMKEVGIADKFFSVGSYGHMSALYEDSYGIARVIEPSGRIDKDSHYLYSGEFQEPYFLSRKMSDKKTHTMELKLHGSLQRAHLAHGDHDIIVGILHNWLANLPTDTPSESTLHLVGLLLQESGDDASLLELAGILTINSPERPQRAQQSGYYFLKALHYDNFQPMSLHELLTNEKSLYRWATKNAGPTRIDRIVKAKMRFANASIFTDEQLAEIHTYLEEAVAALKERPLYSNQDENPRHRMKLRAEALAGFYAMQNWGKQEFDEALDKLKILERGAKEAIKARQESAQNHHA